ncbi:hypothetical protein BDF19DRAFT_242227 [Syncephalis fuscata]|nr:hypothetical protein BDF19DRAFT_242227 [Syncephalis fuscata]
MGCKAAHPRLWMALTWRASTHMPLTFKGCSSTPHFTVLRKQPKTTDPQSAFAGGGRVTTGVDGVGTGKTGVDVVTGVGCFTGSTVGTDGVGTGRAGVVVVTGTGSFTGSTVGTDEVGTDRTGVVVVVTGTGCFTGSTVETDGVGTGRAGVVVVTGTGCFTGSTVGTDGVGTGRTGVVLLLLLARVALLVRHWN